MSFCVKKRDKIFFVVENCELSADVIRMTGKIQLQLETEIERATRMVNDGDDQNKERGLALLYNLYLDLLQQVVEDIHGADQPWPESHPDRRAYLDSCGWLFVQNLFLAYFSRGRPSEEDKKK